MNIPKTLKLATVLITAMMMSGCPTDPIVSKTIKWYEVIGFQKPKRFKVSLRDESGREYPMLYVSKRCSAWEKLEIGSSWQFVEVVRQGKSGVYTEIEGVSALCDRLQAM